MSSTATGIGIVVYPGAQPAAVHGLVDLFDTADHLHLMRDPGAPRLGVETITALEDLATPRRALAAVILPPSIAGVPSPAPGLTRWLLERHREGTLLCSVCVGGFVLAETGLLTGRPVATHWALRDQFAARFPEVALDTDRLVVDDGDVITAGGFMAWVDLALRLVDRFLGPPVMLATARYFLVDPGGREQLCQSFAPPLTHGDAAVLRVQRWLHARSGDKVTLPAMAREAGLGERTFLRRFTAATALRPTEYVQRLRVHKARDLLEHDALTVNEIAWRVGYADANAFRKVFLRVMGLSPGEYRRRFGLAR